MKIIALDYHFSQSDPIYDNRWNQGEKRMKHYQPATYRITVEGFLDESWSDRVGSMKINTTRHTDQGSMTTLVGRVKDQAELFGLLNTLYEFHLPLHSVKYLASD